jgi:ATP-dependent RNA helicase SUPV3L1/SUV3
VLQLQASAELTGLARGIGYQVAEALGVLERSKVLQEMRSLDQDGRAALRKHGVRFGAYHLYLPALLKPAPRILATQLWALKNGGLDQKGIDEIAHLAGSGRTSIPVDPTIAKGLYRAAGFRVCGGRAVRVDILERLADLIRPAIAYRPGLTPGEPPPGTADAEWFAPTVSMTSLVGCSGEDFSSILRSLGYVMERRPGPAIAVPLVPARMASPPATDAAADPGATAEVAEGEASTQIADPPAEPGIGGGAGAEGSAEATELAPIEPDAVETQGEGLDSAELAPAEGAEFAAEAVALPAETLPEETAAIADAGEGAVAAEAATDETQAPAEPVLIEVWRLHRQHRDSHHARQNRGRPARRGEQRAGTARAEGEGPTREGERAPRRRHGGPRPEGRPQGDRGPPLEQRAQPEPDAVPAEKEAGRRSREHRGPPRDQRRDREQHQRSPAAQRPERRERAPDPNSPFAKLLALKAQLEGRDGDKR